MSALADNAGLHESRDQILIRAVKHQLSLRLSDRLHLQLLADSMGVSKR
ncbi:hypothetical protein [Candidimonas sp. SYP-B2681]|nr:hypothetical protein [Candidimonas sp. SYP-B2681]